MNLGICCPSTGGHEKAVVSWNHSSVVYPDIEGPQAGYLQKVERFRRDTNADVIAYFHSDLIITEPTWAEYVLGHFDKDPDLAVVSFFGAHSLGHPDIYKIKYDFRQLARGQCISNLSNAEAHGARVNSPTDVAMIDNFSQIVRKSFLDELGGWPVETYAPSHCSDLWICLQAHRHGKKVRFLPVECEHASGGVRGDGKFDYPAWCATTKWGSDDAMHKHNHWMIYNEFRDVLPVVK